MTESRGKSPKGSGGRGSVLLQKVDRWVGIPLVWLLGALRRKRRLPDDIRSIAVLETAAIGDTILLAGPLADIRQAYPNAEIVLFLGDSNAAMASLIEGPDRVVILPVPKPLAMLRVLRQRSFDLLLDFGPWPRMNAILSCLARAKFTAGFRTAGQLRHFAYDCVADHLASRHELENLRALPAACGIATGAPPRIAINPSAEKTVSAIVRRPYVVMHPWPGGVKSYLKQWPDDRWVEVMRAIFGLGYAVYVVGGAGDRERTEALIRSANAGADGAVSLAGQLNLSQTAALLAGAAGAICVNSGIMHLSAALDVPLVGIHGPTAPHRWGPIGTRSAVVVPDCPGCGYLNLGFEYPSDPPPCMESVTAHQVIAAFGTLDISPPAVQPDKDPAATHTA